MKRLSPEEREQQWRDYFNKTGCYAEESTQTVDTFLRVDTQAEITNTQSMLHNTQITHVTQDDQFDLKKLEREVTIKTLLGLAAALVVFYVLSRALS